MGEWRVGVPQEGGERSASCPGRFKPMEMSPSTHCLGTVEPCRDSNTVLPARNKYLCRLSIQVRVQGAKTNFSK
jgi:hypothetical protein